MEKYVRNYKRKQTKKFRGKKIVKKENKSNEKRKINQQN